MKEEEKAESNFKKGNFTENTRKEIKTEKKQQGNSSHLLLLVTFIAIIITCIIVIIILLLDKGLSGSETTVQILLSVLGSMLTIIFIELVYQQFTANQFKKIVKDDIIKALAVDKEIINDYKSDKITGIIENCFSAFWGSYAKEFSNFVGEQLECIKKDFSYDVDLKCIESNKDLVSITQTVSYTKLILSPRNEKLYLKCFFTLGDKKLDTQFLKKDLFFREEILYQPFIKDLTDPKKSKEDILKLLGLELKLEGTVIKNDDIKLEFIKDEGIEISTEIDPKFITKEDRFKVYTAGLKFTYTAQQHGFFYCVFADPTLNTNFCICFNDCADIPKVDKMPLISSSKPYSLEEHLSRICFDCKGMIFPRSGIIFHW